MKKSAKKRKPSAENRDQSADMSGPTSRHLERIVEALNEGTKLSAAYRLAGIKSTTFYDWMAKGKDPANVRHAAFRAGVLEARYGVQEKLTGAIMNAITTDWKAASWLLPRLFPSEFGARAPIEPAVKQPATATTPEEHRELLESIRRALGGKVD